MPSTCNGVAADLKTVPTVYMYIGMHLANSLIFIQRTHKK